MSEFDGHSKAHWDKQLTAGVVDWLTLIAGAAKNRPKPVRAQTFKRRYKTASQAVELYCRDGNHYVVKGLRNDVRQGRMLFNDQIAARLGTLLHAPIPEVALVEVTPELISTNPDSKGQMGHMLPGLAHGSLRIDGVTEGINNFNHPGDGDNRARYAILAILFGWLIAVDMHFIFKKAWPRLVYSHDHGQFFPGGPNWTIASLRRALPPRAEATLVTSLKLQPDELVNASEPLRAVQPAQIAGALAAPPDEWGVSLDERAALAGFLHHRQMQLLVTLI